MKSISFATSLVSSWELFLELKLFSLSLNKKPWKLKEFQLLKEYMKKWLQQVTIQKQLCNYDSRWKSCCKNINIRWGTLFNNKQSSLKRYCIESLRYHTIRKTWIYSFSIFDRQDTCKTVLGALQIYQVEAIDIVKLRSR